MTKKLKAQTAQSASGDGVSALVQALSVTHQLLQAQAARSVDTALVVRNWLFGWHLVEFENASARRQEVYGKNLMDKLSMALSSQGIKGVSPTNLRLCRSFYVSFQKIQQTVSAESSSATPQPPDLKALKDTLSLGWSHYVVLLSVSNAQARSFYEIEARQGSWGVRELKRQIDSALFERLALSRNKDEVKALAQVGQVLSKPVDVIKNPYVLEFLDLPAHPAYSEQQLELTLPANSNIYAAQYQLYLPSKEELRQKIQEAEAAWEAAQ